MTPPVPTGVRLLVVPRLTALMLLREPLAWHAARMPLRRPLYQVVRDYGAAVAAAEESTK